MVRHITLGNGSLLVNLDDSLRIRDLYFPYAGQENHVLGKELKIGVDADNFTWLKNWDTEPGYREDTIVTDSRASREDEELEMEMESCVNCDRNIFIREIELKNKRDERRSVEMFFYQDFDLYGLSIGDTCFFHPEYNGLIHYRKKRYIMTDVRKEGSNSSEYSDYGIHRDQPDPAELNSQNIAQGDIYSVVSIQLDLPPEGSEKFYYILNTGEDLEEVTSLNSQVEDEPEKLVKETEMCWRGYLGNLEYEGELEEKFDNQLRRSLLVIRSETNHNGAITAANDSDNLQFNKDTYGYVWPRDGAFIAESMASVGYSELVRPFFDFMEDVIHEDGYFLHKYNPDKSLGSSWHPWVENGEKRLPIQEDETALVIWSLKRFYEETGDRELLEEKWDSMVKPAADFMVEFFDEERDLPKPSFDLWEERRYLSTFTVSTVYAGLKAAYEIACELDKEEEVYMAYANRIKEEGLKHLRSEETLRYGRGIEDGELVDKVSAPLLFLGRFGLVDEEDEYFENTVNAIKYDLTNEGVGGIARYRGDMYHATTHDFDEVPGNPWIICTLWLGQHLIRNADSGEDLEEGKEILEWVCENSMDTGLLPEQLDPYTGDPKSVAPLTWSHSTFITTARKYAEKKKELNI